MNVKCHILHQTYLFQKIKKSFPLNKKNANIHSFKSLGLARLFWKVSSAVLTKAAFT